MLEFASDLASIHGVKTVAAAAETPASGRKSKIPACDPKPEPEPEPEPEKLEAEDKDETRVCSSLKIKAIRVDLGEPPLFQPAVPSRSPAVIWNYAVSVPRGICSQCLFKASKATNQLGYCNFVRSKCGSSWFFVICIDRHDMQKSRAPEASASSTAFTPPLGATKIRATLPISN
ncbi:hypothetical protein TruAng_006733 [Truncatella angustata]|nr:hypothetical protein TruAng_006733 [Truncatella angustata]